MPTASPIATPRTNGRTAFATCLGCRGTRWLDGTTRLCRDCTELVEREAPAYCGRCGFPISDRDHTFMGCASTSTVGYCAVDGWWLGTHTRCVGV